MATNIAIDRVGRLITEARRRASICYTRAIDFLERFGDSYDSATGGSLLPTFIGSFIESQQPQVVEIRRWVSIAFTTIFNICLPTLGGFGWFQGFVDAITNSIFPTSGLFVVWVGLLWTIESYLQLKARAYGILPIINWALGNHYNILTIFYIYIITQAPPVKRYITNNRTLLRTVRILHRVFPFFTGRFYFWAIMAFVYWISMPVTYRYHSILLNTLVQASMPVSAYANYIHFFRFVSIHVFSAFVATHMLWLYLFLYWPLPADGFYINHIARWVTGSAWTWMHYQVVAPWIFAFACFQWVGCFKWLWDADLYSFPFLSAFFWGRIVMLTVIVGGRETWCR